MLKIKNLTAIALLVWVTSAVAQSPFVYSLPKTVLKIEVTVEKTSEQTGRFYQYAQRYLATNEIITENKESCRILSVSVTPVTLPNSDHTFLYNGLINNNLSITVDEQGILTGLNNFVSPKPQKLLKTFNSISAHTAKRPEILQLTEDDMMAASTAKMAEGAAKKIYKIREGRLDLLSGDAEHVPSGEAMRELLKKMDSEEQKLTELFVGKITQTTEKKTIFFEPEKPTLNQVIFRISNTFGIVAADDLSGEPVYLHLTMSDKRDIASNSSDAKKKDAIVLYYTLPVSGNVKIDDAKNQYFSGEFVFPQYGNLLSLTESSLPKSVQKVLIDNTTGRLLGIENVQR